MTANSQQDIDNQLISSSSLIRLALSCLHTHGAKGY